MKCGAKVEARSEPGSVHYEYCRVEITQETIWSRATWLAQATGPKGVYVVGESKKFQSGPAFKSATERRDEQHKLLVKKLLEDGWERNPTADGPQWYQQAFRRPV